MTDLALFSDNISYYSSIDIFVCDKNKRTIQGVSIFSAVFLTLFDFFALKFSYSSEMYVRSFLHVLLSLLVQVWLVSFSNSKEKLKILVSAPTLGWSHLQFQSRIADVLVEAGHEVVSIEVGIAAFYYKTKIDL